MITRTFLDKCTTIMRDTNTNYGLNPISMLNYGPILSRILVHFDLSKVKELIEDGTYADLEKVSHILKMKNCASVNNEKTKQLLSSPDYNGVKERAASFTLIAFEVPQFFDEGVGFDNTNDFWLVGKRATSKDGATWYNSTNEELWPEEGIYSIDTLYKEYDNYLNGNDSIVIAAQHFDHGNENLELDLTNYVNKCIDETGDTNYGICIAFVPELENKKDISVTQYVGFFNNKTNTVFNPVLETRYDCDIRDDRYNFALNKKNKLYLYSFIGGKLENLDQTPKCQIESSCDESDIQEMTVMQEGKGIYSIELMLPSSLYKKDTVMYDTWYDLYYEGEPLEDADMQFATISSRSYFSVGNKVIEPKILNPIVVGIHDNEKVNRGEERMIKVFYRIPYTNSEFKLVNESWYRIYVKDGDREVTIVDWDKLLKMGIESFFILRTNEYVPTEYHIDIKAKFGDEIRIFKNELTFKIVSDMADEHI